MQPMFANFKRQRINRSDQWRQHRNVNTNLRELVSAHRPDSAVTCRSGRRHVSHSVTQRPRRCAGTDTTTQLVLIEKRYESAIPGVFQMGIIAGEVLARTSTYDYFKRVPGKFDQPLLRFGRKINIGHKYFLTRPNSIALLGGLQESKTGYV
jgi:hypothetical protein